MWGANEAVAWNGSGPARKAAQRPTDDKTPLQGWGAFHFCVPINHLPLWPQYMSITHTHTHLFVFYCHVSCAQRCSLLTDWWFFCFCVLNIALLTQTGHRNQQEPPVLLSDHRWTCLCFTGNTACFSSFDFSESFFHKRGFVVFTFFVTDFFKLHVVMNYLLLLLEYVYIFL